MATETTSLDSQLRTLIAKWRANWMVTSTSAADRESRVAGCAIEECADELEALLTNAGTVRKDVSPDPLREALLLIKDLSDLEMMDGDGAREIAKLALNAAEYQAVQVIDGQICIVDRRVLEMQPDGSTVLRDPLTRAVFTTAGVRLPDGWEWTAPE